MKPQLLTLPKILDPRGNLTFIENGNQVPFDIRRAYWIYDVPAGEERHGHAFRKATEMIVALSGSFDVVYDTGEGEERVHLGRSFYGLLVPAMTWRRMDNFSTNSVALVLSSTGYDECDYIRDKNIWTEELLAQNHGANAEEPLIAADGMTLTAAESKIATDVSQTSAGLSFGAPEGHELDDCMIVDLSRHCHRNGSLTVVDNADNLFPVRRVFYLYDVPGDSERGGHSHFRAHEFITAASGAFDVTVTDGVDSRTFTLNRPYKALYIPNGLWRSLNNFSSGSVCLVLTSEPYCESDYCRSMSKYRKLYVKD